MTRTRMAVLAAVLTILPGCGGDSGPDDPPPVGRYALTVSITGASTSGTMVLTHTSTDSLAGRWEVPDYEDQMELGFFNVDAWVVAARERGFAGVTFFRLQRSGDGLRCAEARFNDGRGGVRVGSCTTAYQGP